MNLSMILPRKISRFLEKITFLVISESYEHDYNTNKTSVSYRGHDSGGPPINLPADRERQVADREVLRIESLFSDDKITIINNHNNTNNNNYNHNNDRRSRPNTKVICRSTL